MSPVGHVANMEPLDLQIHIVSLSGITPWNSGGLPRFEVRGSFSENTRDSVRTQPSVQGTHGHEVLREPLYIAICNSQVVETVRFSFSEDEISNLMRDLARNRMTPHIFVDFGVRLFEALFQRGVRDIYRELQSRARRENNRLRVTIATAAPELAMLPWELLCDPYPQLLPIFLCQDRNLDIVRALRVFNRADFTSHRLGVREGIRILVVRHSPIESPIDVEADAELLAYAAENSGRAASFHIEHLSSPTTDEFRTKLRGFDPHILHVAAHAGYAPQEGLGYIMLAPSAHGEPSGMVNAYRFATIAKEAGSLQLIFLNTCLGSRSDSSSVLSGVAQCLHAVEIPNVIALQFALRDSTAHSIVLHFYSHLFRRNDTSIEETVGELRRRMFQNGYLAQESFGITFFQTNTRLFLAGIDAATPNDDGGATSGPTLPIDDVGGFSGWVESHKAKHSEKIVENVFSDPDFSPLLNEGSAIDVETLVDVLQGTTLVRANEIFEGWPATLTALSRTLDRLVPSDVIGGLFNASNGSSGLIRAAELFAAVAGTAKRIALSEIEKKSFQTAIVLMPEQDLETYLKENDISSANLEQVPDILDRRKFAAAQRQAQKVNGSTLALVVCFDWDGRMPVRTMRVPLRQEELETPTAFSASFPQWVPVKRLVARRGCALAVPAGGARLKLIVGGQQILEYFHGRWFPADFQRLYEDVVRLAKDCEVSESVLISIMEKALFASDKRVGSGIFLQRKVNIIEKFKAKDATGGTGSPGVGKDKVITSMLSSEFLDLVAGDYSVVISEGGGLLGVNVPLLPSAEVEVERIAGSRHLLAQTITKATDALAIVISESGPVCIMRDGKIAVTYLREDSHSGGC